MNWALEQMENPNICAVMESKMNQVINEINKKESIIERDPLDSELRILGWIFFQVCKNEVKKFERL
jgi:sensor histidine kinase regulating citrate/malate metabolism